MRHRHTSPAERGQVVALFAAALVVLLGFVGLGIDTGRLYLERRSVQAAADAASLAVAKHVVRAPSASNAVLTGVAERYADDNGTPGASVVRVGRPATGRFAGDADAYEVVVTRQVPTTFVRLIPGVPAAMTVEARAVALRPGAVSLLCLEDTRKCFDARNAPDIRIGFGTLQANSANDTGGHGAVEIEGCTRFLAASPATVNGRFVKNGNPTIAPEDPIDHTGRTWPDPFAGIAEPQYDEANDPDLGRPVPACGLCGLAPLPAVVPNVRAPGGYVHDDPKLLQLRGGTYDLCPGIYYGGIRVDNGAVVNLRTCGVPGPAIYVMANYGLRIGNGTVIGTPAEGVMIYNSTTHDDSSASIGRLNVSNGGRLVLKAPTSGPYRGIAYFDDRYREVKHANRDDDVSVGFDVDGNATVEIDGEIYVRHGSVDFDNHPTVTLDGIIARRVMVSGGDGGTCAPRGTQLTLRGRIGRSAELLPDAATAVLVD